MTVLMDRRQLLRGAALLGGTVALGGLGAAAVAMPALAAPAGFPNYQYIGTPFN